MKTLLWKLIIPATIISFAGFTKWWYIGIDEMNEVFTGFPFPYVCAGWHTSLSLQIFVLELALDLMVYFAFWFMVIYAINRYHRKIMVSKPVTIILISISGFIFSVTLFWMSITHNDNLYYIKNPYSLKVIDSGYRFFWEDRYQP
ncbi:MAG TPA: hypothetical protein DHV26_11105, partial [Cytophagales bacterium]|nr:hypothetical protein [Cytophagales bacterium]